MLKKSATLEIYTILTLNRFWTASGKNSRLALASERSHLIPMRRGESRQTARRTLRLSLTRQLRPTSLVSYENMKKEIIYYIWAYRPRARFLLTLFSP